VLSHFEFDYACLCIPDNRAQGYFQNDIVSIGTMPIILAAIASVWGLGMLAIFEPKQGPLMAIPFQDDVATTATVTSIGATMRNTLGPVEMRRPWASVTGAQVNLYVVYKITVCHI
jgi:hypothetical protein